MNPTSWGVSWKPIWKWVAIGYIILIIAANLLGAYIDKKVNWSMYAYEESIEDNT